MPRARARTTTATYEMQNVMWAMTICAERAVLAEQLAEEDQQADAHDDLGRHHRQQEQRLGGARPRNRSRARARPSSVPRTVDTMTATNATWSVTRERVEQVAGWRTASGTSRS